MSSYRGDDRNGGGPNWLIVSWGGVGMLLTFALVFHMVGQPGLAAAAGTTAVGLAGELVRRSFTNRHADGPPRRRLGVKSAPAPDPGTASPPDAFGGPNASGEGEPETRPDEEPDGEWDADSESKPTRDSASA